MVVSYPSEIVSVARAQRLSIDERESEMARGAVASLHDRRVVSLSQNYHRLLPLFAVI